MINAEREGVTLSTSNLTVTLPHLPVSLIFNNALASDESGKVYRGRRRKKILSFAFLEGESTHVHER